MVYVTEKPLTAWAMDEPLNVLPGAAEVLARRGVDPPAKRLTRKRSLGRTCPVDGVDAPLMI